MKTKKNRPWPVRLLRWLAGAAACCVLAGLFILTVIMGQPQNDLSEMIAQEQPLLKASPALSTDDGADLSALLASFPIPVLMCPTNDLTLVSGMSYDTAFEDGFARILSLTYADANQVLIHLTSIYPRRAVELLAEDGLTLKGEGAEVAGCISARMEGNGMIRLHIQGAEGLYTVSITAGNESVLETIIKELQIVQLQEEEHG